jgi:glycosyltransferase involved in cell wall biosynthesis
MPAVTIGLPVYNAAGTLGAAIDSVLKQTFSDWELLVIDDGSTDGSAAVAAATGDPRVRVLSDGVNRGLVIRLNQMVATASSPLFARMDADDLMHPERLERQVACFDADPALCVCGTAAWVMDENNQVYGIRCDSKHREFRGIRSGFIHPTVMGRTQWFLDNPYDSRFVRVEDTELWLRADPATPCSLIPEPLLFYREPLRPQLSKYRASCRGMRTLVRHYWPKQSGRAGTVAAVAASYSREWIYMAAAAAGVCDRLVRRRNRPCTPAELDAAAEVLSRLTHTAERQIAEATSTP